MDLNVPRCYANKWGMQALEGACSLRCLSWFRILIFLFNNELLGILVLSTPFTYRYHGAPNDFNRYTLSYLEKLLKLNKFKLIKKINCGTGPFLASYSLIFDYLKRIPLFPLPIFFMAVLIVKLLSLFQKTKMSTLYPISLFTIAKKID